MKLNLDDLIIEELQDGEINGVLNVLRILSKRTADLTDVADDGERMDLAEISEKAEEYINIAIGQIESYQREQKKKRRGDR